MTDILTRWKRRAGLSCLVAGMITLAGPAAAGETTYDPLEGFNRAMFAVNEGLDTVAIKPIAQAHAQPSCSMRLSTSRSARRNLLTAQ